MFSLEKRREVYVSGSYCASGSCDSREKAKMRVRIALSTVLKTLKNYYKGELFYRQHNFIDISYN